MENARQLAAAVGPWQIAADHSMLPELSLPEIAERWAETAYNGDDVIQAAAKAGAVQGFNEWLAGNPGHDPVD